MAKAFDAILVQSFGGPEGPDDVIPFLENVLRGRNVPRERMLEVAEHYYHFGGVSPINAQNRELIAALRVELDAAGIHLPIYFGNRNWHPLLSDTLREMRDAGIRRALAYATSAYSSYSSCRQYLDDIVRARADVGPGAPEVEKLRPFFNHPGFIEAWEDRVRTSFAELPERRRGQSITLYTAHSIPESMARSCDYVIQLEDVARVLSQRCGIEHWKLVYQSRSGPPTQPWLEPDIADALREAHASGFTAGLVVPIGFTSDHMEVLFDLDTEARQLADELGFHMVRVPTVGTHPRIIRMIRELIEERLFDKAERPSCGSLGPRPDRCPEGCCPSGRPPRSTP